MSEKSATPTGWLIQVLTAPLLVLGMVAGLYFLDLIWPRQRNSGIFWAQLGFMAWLVMESFKPETQRKYLPGIALSVATGSTIYVSQSLVGRNNVPLNTAIAGGLSFLITLVVSVMKEVRIRRTSTSDAANSPH